jgi:hypothetical protein
MGKTYGIMARKLLILTVVTFWALMTGLFIQKQYVVYERARNPDRRRLLDPNYHMGIYYDNQRIGEFHFNSYPRVDSPGGGYRLVSSLHLAYPDVGEAHITGESLTDNKLLLDEFRYYVKYRLKMFDEQDARVEGTVKGGKLGCSVQWGTFEKSFETAAPEGISLYDPITPWIVDGKLRPGRRYTVEVFNRFSRRSELAKVKIIRAVNASFQGERVPAYEVETVVADMKSTFIIGRDGKIYRMESPLGFSLLREPPIPLEKEPL